MPQAVARTASLTQFIEIATAAEPFVLQDGSAIGPVTIAYETHGKLNADKSNAILLFHALSGSHHFAGHDAIGAGTNLWTEECHEGWWNAFVGPGRALDTDKYFIVCCNYFGGCYGSTGPSSIDPATGKPWGSRFPWPTIGDIVDTQLRVIDRLGIKVLHAAVGGSLGGFCAINLAVRYPDRVKCVIPIASGLRATQLTRTHNFEQIFAIEEDQDFRGGDYYDGNPPRRGLTLARMISHKTFVSLDLMKIRARKEIVQPDDYVPTYKLKHQIESYMLHQGRKFVLRFDANSYLRIVNAWQSFDLVADLGEGDAAKALWPCLNQKWLVFSIDVDVCFWPEEQEEIVAALHTNGIDCQYMTVHSDKGHDSFLLEPQLYAPQIAYMLGAVGK